MCWNSSHRSNTIKCISKYLKEDKIISQSWQTTPKTKVRKVASSSHYSRREQSNAAKQWREIKPGSRLKRLVFVYRLMRLSRLVLACLAYPKRRACACIARVTFRPLSSDMLTTLWLKILLKILNWFCF